LLQEFGHMKCLEFIQMHGLGLWRIGPSRTVYR